MDKFYFFVEPKQNSSNRVFGTLSENCDRFTPKGYKSSWDLQSNGMKCFDNNKAALSYIFDRVLGRVNKLRENFPPDHSSIVKKMAVLCELQRKLNLL